MSPKYRKLSQRKNITQHFDNCHWCFLNYFCTVHFWNRSLQRFVGTFYKLTFLLLLVLLRSKKKNHINGLLLSASILLTLEIIAKFSGTMLMLNFIVTLNVIILVMLSKITKYCKLYRQYALCPVTLAKPSTVIVIQVCIYYQSLKS